MNSVSDSLRTDLTLGVRKKLYPALAVMNLMELRPDSTMCKERFEELLEGEAENEFDAWLRDRFYPIVAMMTLSGDMSGRLRSVDDPRRKYTPL